MEHMTSDIKYFAEQILINDQNSDKVNQKGGLKKPCI